MNETPWGSKQTEYFYQITPDKILDTVEAEGYRATGRVLTHNSMENRVYEIELELEDDEINSVYDKSKIIKFYRPGRWSKEQILDEHQFLEDLTKHDVPVVAPEKLSDGSTVGTVEGLDIYYTIFPKVGGRAPSEMSQEQLEIIGRLLARLHNVGQLRPAPHRIELTPTTYGIQNLKFLLDTRMIPVDLEKRYKTAAEDICQMADPLFQKVKTQRIHGDCHLGNVLWGSQGAFWVDFDDMVTGPTIQDIWLVTPGRDEEGVRDRNTLLNAYESMRHFDDNELKLIEPLRALRYIHFSSWISKRWKDPAFPKAFPLFNSHQYWSEQTRDLEEQLMLIKNK